jgi:hypothetical protein
VGILLGQGDGVFAPKVDYKVEYDSGLVAIADLNGDGKLDLAVANSDSDSVSVLLGRGDGTFGASVEYRASDDVCGVAVADFNGDGRPDIATPNCGASTVSVMLNACWSAGGGGR